MKTTFAFVFSTCFLAVVFAGKCIEQAECGPGTCCSGIPPFGGVCAPSTPEGGKCHLVDKTVAIFGDFYIGPCPCEEGLVCVQQGKKKNDGICQVPPPTTAAPTEAVVDEAGDSGASDDAAGDASNDASDDAAGDASNDASDDAAGDASNDASDDAASDAAPAEAEAAPAEAEAAPAEE